MKISMLSLDDTAQVLSWCLMETKGIMPLRNDTLEIYPELKNNKDIKSAIRSKYDKFVLDNKHLVKEYKELWDKYDLDIKNYFEKLFHVKLDKEVTAEIGLIPVCPRDIQENYFIFIPDSNDFFIQTSIHEICHFYFFELCKKILPKWDYDMFDKPALLWYLSEIMIDPLLNNSELDKIYHHKYKAYDIFYKTNINNKNIVEIITDIYNNNSIEDTIIKGLKLLEDNKEIFLEQCK